jgi:hypothetical protein
MAACTIALVMAYFECGDAYDKLIEDLEKKDSPYWAQSCHGSGRGGDDRAGSGSTPGKPSLRLNDTDPAVPATNTASVVSSQNPAASSAVAAPDASRKAKARKGGKSAKGGKGKKRSMVQVQGNRHDSRDNARANSNHGHGKKDANRGNANNRHGKGKGQQADGKGRQGQGNGHNNHGKGGKRR